LRATNWRKPYQSDINMQKSYQLFLTFPHGVISSDLLPSGPHIVYQAPTLRVKENTT